LLLTSGFIAVVSSAIAAWRLSLDWMLWSDFLKLFPLYFVCCQWLWSWECFLYLVASMNYSLLKIVCSIDFWSYWYMLGGLLLMLQLWRCISSMQFQKVHGTKCLEFSHSQLCTNKTFTTMTMKVDYALGMVVGIWPNYI
jgi:hypothetical protein